MDGNTVLIPNVAPDIGDSAPYNSLFTLFGQFFDHGLDLISKGGSGTVYIPLQPDDPLYVPGSHSNFMVMTRASRDGDGDTINTTTPWVDQNQTYTSHASHQVFLREYMTGPDGKTIATGRPARGCKGSRHLGRRQGAGQGNARHRPDRCQCRQRSAAAHRPLRQLHPASGTGYAQVIVGLGTMAPNTSDDIVISRHPGEPGRPRECGPHRPRLPRRHRPCGRACLNAGVLAADGDSAPGAMPTARRPAVNSRGQHCLRQRVARRPLHHG